MTIDFHAHPVPDAHLQFMDEAGIDYTVLSLPTPHIHHGDDEKSLQAAMEINDELALLQSDRFGWTACLPLPYVDGSIAEIRRCMEKGALGVKVPTNANGVYLGDPILDSVMEELNRRNALVIIHPCRAQERPQDCITGSIAAIYEYPADTTRAVLNMIAHRIMTRFPNIRWIVPHGGSFLPYMLQRFSGVSGILASMGMMETVDARAELDQLYFDIAGDPEPVALDMLRMVASDDRIVFGSDYSHSPANVILMKKQRFDANPRWNEIRAQIYSGNGLVPMK